MLPTKPNDTSKPPLGKGPTKLVSVKSMPNKVSSLPSHGNGRSPSTAGKKK